MSSPEGFLYCEVYSEAAQRSASSSVEWTTASSRCSVNFEEYDILAVWYSIDVEEINWSILTVICAHRGPELDRAVCFCSMDEIEKTEDLTVSRAQDLWKSYGS